MEEMIDSQINTLGINDFLNAAKKYTENVFPDMNISNLFEKSINGHVSDIFDIGVIQKLLFDEIYVAISLMASLMIVIIIHSIFKAIIENLENQATSQIVYFVQYLIIVTILINTFVAILDLTKETIENVVSFMNLLIPLLITLMLTTGTLVTTSICQPILVFLTSFIGNFINLFLIPLLMISITISIISNVSDKVQIDKLSKFMKSFIVWILGIILTIFTCVLSLEGTLSSSVDGITAKTAKVAVSNFIPIVGKIMGDTVDSVIGCGNILKNSLGTIGIIIIVGIVLLPMIKILTLWFSFKLTSAMCEVVADNKIVKLMEQVADSYKVLLAVLCSVSIMFIIGITIVIKITNSALMYR